MTKPDFIIIGSMKSATSTLHEQLARQKGIFMSVPKEPNYFSDNEVYKLGELWYEGLFGEAQPSDLCGESSTHYTKLPDYPLTIDRMKLCLSKPKLIYVMRHPIDRLISHYIHQWSQNIIRCDINSAIFEYPELINYSCYGKQMQPYFNEYGMDAVLPIFTELIKLAPQSQLEAVAEFIGHSTDVHWQYDLKPQNISSDRIRAFYGYGLLIESKPMAWLRRNFIPQFLRNKVKNRLVMCERPIISDDNIAKLTEVFDNDMKSLSEWLGMTLTCKTYVEQVTKNIF